MRFQKHAPNYTRLVHYNRDVKHNLAARLKKALPSDDWALLQQIADAAQELGMPLYVVGGAPRDLLLGQPIGDFDLVVVGEAAALAKKLAAKYGGQVTVHGKFGTAKWDRRNTGARGEGPENDWRSLDFVTARSETYKHPAALPTVEPGTIEDDLRRRDFTINSLAIRLDAPHVGEIRDDFGGWEDIEARAVRVLHDGSFIDDPTRMYRAARYERRYGFHIAAATLGLIPAARPIVQKLSAHRIRHELDLILEEARAVEMLERLGQLDLLQAIHPALSFDDGAARRIKRTASDVPFPMPHWPAHGIRWVAWLMAMPQAEIDALNGRLHFGAGLFKALSSASRLSAEMGSLQGAPASRWVGRLDAEPLLGVYAVFLASEPGASRTALSKYLAEWRHVRPKTNGNDLKKLGLRPGAEYGRILGELRRARLDGQIQDDADEHGYLQALLERQSDP